MEYTRLDELIDVMFTTAVDIEGAIISHEDEDTEGWPAPGFVDTRLS